MRKYNVKLQDGTFEKVEGQKFTHYIENISFEFFVHKNLSPGGSYTITHLKSGSKVLDLPYLTLLASLNDVKAASHAAIDDLVARKGAARVLSVLRTAEIEVPA